MDTYRAIYDAAKEALDISWLKDAANSAVWETAAALSRPSVLYRPELVQDGNAFLAMYGDLPTGCVGCGSTPAEAMADFDAAWHRTAIVPSKA